MRAAIMLSPVTQSVLRALGPPVLQFGLPPPRHGPRSRACGCAPPVCCASSFRPLREMWVEHGTAHVARSTKHCAQADHPTELGKAEGRLAQLRKIAALSEASTRFGSAVISLSLATGSAIAESRIRKHGV